MGDLFKVHYDVDARAVLPKKVLEEQCVYLNKKTNGIVIGRVAEYSGSIGPNVTPGLYDFIEKTSYISSKIRQKTDIQERLGEMGEEQFTYEFFLTSKSLPDYKFRVLFMQYGIMGYPLKIILEGGVAEELNGSEEKYVYFLQNKMEYEELLGKILNSDRFTDIVTRLIQLYNS